MTATAPELAAKPAQQSVTLTRQAVLGAIDGVRDSIGHIADTLPKLAASQAGIAGDNDVFVPYINYGTIQLQWLKDSLGGAALLTDTASTVGEPEMELALLRLSGPRLQATLLGAHLLSAWLDFLNLADAILQHAPFYSDERLVRDLDRVRKMLEPSMTALSSLEPAQVEATASTLPSLMGQLTRESYSIREAVRVATERGGQMMLAAQLVEMLTQASMMKLSLPRLPPAAPATLGVGLVMGANGVMMGTRVAVSAEWVEMMRRLVRAGVISAPVAGTAVRIHTGQVLMSQSHDELPKGVRDALGDGPEVRGMHQTGRAGAGMAEPPRHHVLPREHREWFEKRGFTGDMSIDRFCVKMEQAKHEAIHGGGDWRLGRLWPGEWNQMIMKALREAELEAGRMLTRNEILKVVAGYMKEYKIPMNFTPWSGR
ncbi:DUF2380 domain-containing protein [Melittangium boletus]|uniref:DUF2380 domain-containing protein n=1 Tax=Melittangium boletus TaxID=83453 RepID=UPI0031843D90